MWTLTVVVVCCLLRALWMVAYSWQQQQLSLYQLCSQSQGGELFILYLMISQVHDYVVDCDTQKTFHRHRWLRVPYNCGFVALHTPNIYDWNWFWHKNKRSHHERFFVIHAVQLHILRILFHICGLDSRIYEILMGREKKNENVSNTKWMELQFLQTSLLEGKRWRMLICFPLTRRNFVFLFCLNHG